MFFFLYQRYKSELLYITRDLSVWIVFCFNNRRDLYTKLYNTNIIQFKVGKRQFFSTYLQSLVQKQK